MSSAPLATSLRDALPGCDQSGLSSRACPGFLQTHRIVGFQDPLDDQRPIPFVAQPRQILGIEALADDGPGGGNGLRVDGDAVGPVIGDVAVFIEALRYLHRAASREA